MRTCARATKVLHQLSVYLEGGEHANKMVESLRKVTSWVGINSVEFQRGA